jgi:N-acetylglucosaminyldiphosphoundecaprenol N-acetyl-beta-D-mannosaminyltransferase
LVQASAIFDSAFGRLHGLVVQILGIPVYDQPLARALDEIISTCVDDAAPRANRLISATGAHGLVHAQQDREFAATLRDFTINLPDGLPGVWVGRYLKRAHNMERVRGPDFFRVLMTHSATAPIKHYLCGGKEGVAERLRTACSEQFSNNNIVGTYCPPFRPLTDDEWVALAADIDASGADVVWIGLSTPKQERFARQLAQHVNVHYIATVGAAFDFHIGAVREAPLFVQRSGFEWFYRMVLDPKRLLRRYAEIVPLFLFYNVKDVLHSRRDRRGHSERQE